MNGPLRNPALVLLLLLLAACTGPGSALAPSALQPLTADEEQSSGQLPPPDGTAPDGGPMASAGVQTAPSPQLAAIATNARVRFAPVVGATAQAVPTLAARLRARAAQRGIAVATANDPATTYVMKGYFSAVADNHQTTVIYVWDVLDPAGSRLHRIQGQQKQPGAGEGWAAVTAPTLEAIADRTIDDLAAWISASAG